MSTSPAFQSAAELKPLPFDPAKLNGLSERLMRSHWENNYGGSVKALAQVKAALVRTQTAVELVNLFTQTHIPQAEQALASATISYQTGKLDFLSLLDRLRIVEQVHLEHIAAAAAFEKAYAELERAVGRELPRT